MTIYDNTEQEFKIKCKENLQELINYINSDTKLSLKFYFGFKEINSLYKTIDKQEKELNEYKTFFDLFKKLTK